MKVNDTVKSILTFKFEMLAVLIIAIGTTGFSIFPSQSSTTESKKITLVSPQKPI